MIELPAVDGPNHDAVEQIAFIKDVGRVASFRLPRGGAVPESRPTPVLLVASTALVIEVGDGARGARRLELAAGQAHFFATGVNGLANLGDADIRFTLIDVPEAD